MDRLQGDFHDSCVLYLFFSDICDDGERYDPSIVSNNKCEQCPVGTYRKKGRDDPLVCISCPPPFTTESPGAEDIGLCVRK